MGYVYVDATLGDARKSKTKSVRLLADTGAGYLAISKDLAAELGISPQAQMEVTLADGRSLQVDVSLAFIGVAGREGVVPALIMDIIEPVLGTFTLEVLGLSVDPSTRRLKPERPYTMMM